MSETSSLSEPGPDLGSGFEMMDGDEVPVFQAPSDVGSWQVEPVTNAIVLDKRGSDLPEGVHKSSFLIRGQGFQGLRGRRTAAPVAIIASTSTWKIATGMVRTEYRDPSGQRYALASTPIAARCRRWGGLIMIDGPEQVR